MAFSIKNGWAGVARFGGIGDNLIAASPCRAFKKKGLKVEVITCEPCHVVFENNPWIDKLSVKSKREISGTNMAEWQKWFWGRADEYDVFAHLSHSCESALAFFPDQTAFFWPDHVRRSISNRNYLEFVHDIAGVPYEFAPLYYSSPEERAKALETKSVVAKNGKPVVCWAISGTRLDKIHPRLPGMVARVIKEVNVNVVLMGAPGKNFEDAKKIQDHVAATNGTDEGLHLAISYGDPPNWPIRRSLSFAQVCDLVVTVDTGIGWAVAFEEMPKIVMVSHASAVNITKHWPNTTTLHADPERVPCWPCHRLHNTQDTCVPNKDNSGAACISDISVETVVGEIRKKFQERTISAIPEALQLAAE